MNWPTLFAIATLPCVWHSACVELPPVPPAVPEASCEDVCAHWRDLGCHEAAPSPAGASCEQLCDAFQQYWNLSCMASVEQCEEIDECP